MIRWLAIATLAASLCPAESRASDTTAICAVQAAAHYQVPLLVVRSILAQEAGPEHGMLTNTNKSVDIGPMGINSIHLGELQQYGINAEKLRSDPCLNVFIGTWLLRRSIVQAGGNLWKGIGNYHSKTPSLHRDYQLKVWKKMQRVALGR